MKKEIISAKNAPRVIGPYSQAVKVGNFVYTSGQIPIDCKTNEVWGTTPVEQTEKVFENLCAVIKEAGGTLENVIKTTVFIANMEHFSQINEVYEKYFSSNFPARSCIQVARLPKDVLVEIEAVLYI